ncbi:MAG: aldo/keto reductase [Planctomycetota bacterium]|jgi:aryl-alcohol dehydrogenase-like predicted oxidoreductase
MQTRKLGYTDLELTTVGLGTWAIGGPDWQYGWGPQDDDEAIGAILTALDKGINWIDTAAAYGLGHSEELIGKALKQTRQKPIIATKCSLLWDDKGQIISCLKTESIRQECHASLKRLDVDTIDLYQIHWPRPDEDIEQAWEEMARLAEESKVRYLGVSNFNLDQIKRVQKIHPVASLQPHYNMLQREVEDELLGYCADNNIGVIAYSPMERGLLTGKFTQERLAALPLHDHRRKSPDFHDPQFAATLLLVDQLRPIAERNGMTLAQLAISWILRRKEVTAAIVGARRPDQITETAAAGDGTLAPEDADEIEKLLAERLEKIGAK